MEIHSTHSSRIEGTDDFAKWLAGQSGVCYVNIANIRASHIASGKRDPTFVPTKYSVKVSYYAGGKMQHLFVFPFKGRSIEVLSKNLKKFYEHSKVKGGSGVSSKETIKLPQSILEKIEETMKQENVGISDTVLLTERQAVCYEEILKMQPTDTPNLTHFVAEGITRLIGKYTGPNNVDGVLAALKAKGLVKKRDKVKGKRSNEWLVTIKPYTVVSRSGIQKIVEAPAPIIEMTPPTTTKSISHEVNKISEGFVNLHKMGFEVSIENGELKLSKKL